MTQLALDLATTRNDWCSKVAPLIVQLMAMKPSFSSDDVWVLIENGTIDGPENWNSVGALFAKLHAEGKVECVGRRMSKRKSANGRAINHYTLVTECQ